MTTQINAMIEPSVVVAEARSWIGTRYHIMGRRKGAGCDCGSFLMSVAVNCGLISDGQMEVYSLDCWQHWRQDKYLHHVMKHAEKLAQEICYRSTKVLPGCLVLSRVVGCGYFNHGGIVTEWPKLVHAVSPRVEEVSAVDNWLWNYREIAIFDFKGVKR